MGSLQEVGAYGTTFIQHTDTSHPDLKHDTWRPRLTLTQGEVVLVLISSATSSPTVMTCDGDVGTVMYMRLRPLSDGQHARAFGLHGSMGDAP